MRAAPWLVVSALLATPSLAKADVPSRTLELDAYGGLARRGGLSAPDAISSRNGGGALAATVLLRSRYFLAPFLDVAYYPLSAGERAADLGRGPELVTNRAWTFGITAGAALDVWRLRLSAGLGAYDLRVQTWAAGERSTVNEIDFGYVVGVAVYPVVERRIRVGLSARAALMVEAEIPVLSIGLTLGGDALSF